MSAASRSALDRAGRQIGWDDPMLAVRWERVQALRQAIARGRYDLDARLDDLLDDPPAALTVLALS